MAGTVFLYLLGVLSIGPTSLKRGEGPGSVVLCGWEGVELVRVKVVVGC